MKIQFCIISDNGDQTYSSIAENFTTAEDASIFVKETIESNPNLTYCAGCEVIVEGHTGDTVYCKKCSKLIPDDSDFSNAGSLELITPEPYARTDTTPSQSNLHRLRIRTVCRIQNS